MYLGNIPEKIDPITKHFPKIQKSGAHLTLSSVCHDAAIENIVRTDV